MWSALGSRIRRVGLVAWVVVLVLLVPSRAWSVEDSAVTSGPAPTSSDSSQSSSPPPSPPSTSDASSSTSEPSPSPTDSSDASVLIDSGQFDALYTVLVALGLGLAVVVLLLSAFVVGSWGDRRG